MKKMNHALQILSLIFLVMISPDAFAQADDTSKIDNLLVYGDGFMFSVKEPAGWTGDIEIAKEYYSNIVFYTSKEEIKRGGAVIQVYAFTKQDEKTQKDLKYDIKGYKQDYKNLQQEDFLVSHKEYKCYSKLVYVANDFYQYTVYVNPGPAYKTGVSVSMNISKQPATEDEMAAFRKIIASLILLKG